MFSSFAIGALFSVSYSVPSQLAAEEEDKTGVANSAMYFAVQGLFQGISTGNATGVVLTAMKEGSKPGTGGTAIAWMTVIAAAGTLVALLLSYWLPKSLIKMGKKD